MKKLLILVALMATSQFASAQFLISNFTDLSAQAYSPFNSTWNGGTPAADQYVQNVGSVSITAVNGGNPDGTGSFDAVFPGSDPGSPTSVNLTGDTTISLTARLDSGNTDTSFTLSLYDSGLTEIGQATFSSSLFNMSSFTTSNIALTLIGGGDITNATYWNLAGDGIPDDIVRASFSNVEAVPEPSTYAMLGLGLLGLYLYRRHRSLRLS